MSPPDQPDIDAIFAVLRRFSNFEGRIAAPGGQAPAYENVVATNIRQFHDAGQPLSLLLPAFPWKNPNTDKTLSRQPDLGEELGLARLDHLCEELGKVYRHGAVLTLVSDFPVYNDLLAMPDELCYDWGIALRKMARAKGFSHVKFTRLANALDLGDGEAMTKTEYLSKTEICRREMEARFLPVDFDLERAINNNRDTELTYQKYVRSASEDLRWGPDIEPAIVADPKRYEQETRTVAKLMTKRLLAYEGLLTAKFPNAIRLSIHRSTGKAKISVPLLPDDDGFGLMPWHCSVLVTADGQYRSVNVKDYRDDGKYEVVTRGGQPHFLREKHPDFEWPEFVHVDHAYGGRILVVNLSEREGDKYLTPEMKLRLANLALRFRSLDVQGFKA